MTELEEIINKIANMGDINASSEMSYSTIKEAKEAIRQLLHKKVPEKKEISQFEKEFMNIPICEKCGNPYGDIHDKLIYNEAIDAIHNEIDKL